MLTLTHTKVAARPGNTSNKHSADTLNSDQVLNPGLYGNTMFEKAFSFRYKDRVRLSFSVREEWKSEYVLLRGLMEFHRPKELTFTYDREQKLVHTDVPIEQLDQLQSFVALVYSMLKKEREFRIALKNAIAFERRYKLEREKVYEAVAKY